MSLDDPLATLRELSRKELASAYDEMINSLRDREMLIHHRIKKELEHLGLEERILMEGKDFTRESEDIISPTTSFNSTRPIESVLSVSEQIRNVAYHKDNNPEERMMLLIENKFNPFMQANFNPEQLKRS